MPSMRPACLLSVLNGDEHIVSAPDRYLYSSDFVLSLFPRCLK